MTIFAPIYYPHLTLINSYMQILQMGSDDLFFGTKILNTRIIFLLG